MMRLIINALAFIWFATYLTVANAESLRVEVKSVDSSIPIVYSNNFANGNFDVSVTLKNITTESVTLYGISCRTDNWTTDDSKRIGPAPKGCMNNGPQRIVLLPQQEKEFHLNLMIFSRDLKMEKRFRIGYVRWLDPRGSEKEQVVWSDNKIELRASSTDQPRVTGYEAFIED